MNLRFKIFFVQFIAYINMCYMSKFSLHCTFSEKLSKIYSVYMLVLQPGECVANSHFSTHVGVARQIAPHVANVNASLNNVVSNVFSRMWSDLSSDMRPIVKALLRVIN